MRKSNPWTLLIGVAIMCVMFGMVIIADTSVKTVRKATENKVDEIWAGSAGNGYASFEAKMYYHQKYMTGRAIDENAK